MEQAYKIMNETFEDKNDRIYTLQEIKMIMKFHIQKKIVLPY